MSLAKPDCEFIAVEKVVVGLREILANSAAFGWTSLIRSLYLSKSYPSTLLLSAYVNWSCEIMLKCLCSQCFPGKPRFYRTISLHLNKDRALLHQSRIVHSAKGLSHLEECILANESIISAGNASESLILSFNLTKLILNTICSFQGCHHNTSRRAAYGDRWRRRFAILSPLM